MAYFYIGTMWFVLAVLVWSDRFFTNHETYTAGITIPLEHRQDACVQEVLKAHKKRRGYMLLAMAATALLCLIPTYAFVYVIWLTVWLTVMVVWDYFLVRKTIRQMYEVKKANGWQKKQAQDGTVLVDTRVSGMKDKMPVSSLFFVLPICGLISFVLWWMLYGAGDKTALVMILCAFSTLVLSVFLYRNIVRAKVRVYSEDSELNLCLNRMSKRLWSGWIVWETCVCTVYCIVSGLYLHYYLQRGMVLFWGVSILVTILILVPLACMSGYIRSMKQHLLTGQLLLEPAADEDEYWLDGWYRNPSDSSSFVETRIGMGITANMAKPSMKWFTYGSLLFALLLCFGSAVLVAVLELSHIEVERKETVIEISGGVFSEEIAYEEIESVMWLSDLPELLRTWGSATKEYLFGEFRLEGYGGANVFVKKGAAGYILITCENAPYLLVNCETEEETQDLYEWLSEKPEENAAKKTENELQ